MGEKAMGAGQGRPTVGFRLQGLSERDGTLFKSFVRLLDHRLEHQWVLHDEAADVCVAHAGPLPRPAPGEKLLALGEPEQGARYHVVLPIHADELEQRLGQLGTAVVAARRPHVGPGLLRLRRWPPAKLLGHPQRMRLATLMTGRQWTAHALCERAGVPESFCQQFLQDLRQADLLVEDVAAAPLAAPRPTTPPAVLAPGLLGRIRLRLGLVSTHP